MNFADFKKRRGELHIAYHAAKRAGDESKKREADKEIGVLEESASRDYQISERMLIHVYTRSWLISIGARRTDRGVNLVQLPRYELECFDHVELHILASLRALVQQYEDGELEELPPSGAWPPKEST